MPRGLRDAAVLYLVCSARPAGARWRTCSRRRSPAASTSSSCATRRPSRDELLAAAAVARRLCDEAGALLILNDRPDLVQRPGADGCHVGQDDMDVPAARALAGEGAIVGQSTHFPGEIDAAPRPTTSASGPCTRRRPSPAGPRSASSSCASPRAFAPVPFFAIGGIDASNVGGVVDAGARRIAVVRAIAEAADPRAAAAELRAAIAGEPIDGIA